MRLALFFSSCGGSELLFILGDISFAHHCFRTAACAQHSIRIQVRAPVVAGLIQIGNYFAICFTASNKYYERDMILISPFSSVTSVAR